MLGGIVKGVSAAVTGVASAAGKVASTVGNAAGKTAQSVASSSGIKQTVSRTAGSVLGGNAVKTVAKAVAAPAAATAGAVAGVLGLKSSQNIDSAKQNLTPTQQVANEMSGYKYEFYNNDQKTNAETEESKSGNCCDLAEVTVEKFKEKGINAELRVGNFKSSSEGGYNGGHYWVRYQDSNGQWQRFDPTAAAEYQSSDKGFSGLDGAYSEERAAQL